MSTQDPAGGGPASVDGLSVFATGSHETFGAVPGLVLSDGTTWSWHEVAGRVATIVGHLRRRFPELEGGGRFYVQSDAGPGTMLAILAAWELGWTVVPLHPKWTADERAAFRRRLAQDFVVEARLEARGVRAFAESKTTRIPRHDARPAASIAAILATSGSSGRPKGVALSERAFLASAAAGAERLGWQDGDRWLLSLPVAHVGGLSILARCVSAGRTVVLPEERAGRFEPAAWMRFVEERGVTLLSMVPTMLRRCLEAGVRPAASVRAVLLGGAAATDELQRRALATGWPLWVTYGASETCSQVATGRVTGDSIGSGIPLLGGVQARASDGILELRGPMLLSGYRPRSLGTGVDADGWFRTGDRAVVEGGGVEGSALRILGRADDVIVSGGENVDPSEVESVLAEHPDVADACVAGVADPEWGSTVSAAVVLRAGATFDADAWIAWMRQRLAPFKTPRRWRIVEALPTNAVGKVDRRRVAEMLADD